MSDARRPVPLWFVYTMRVLYIGGGVVGLVGRSPVLVGVAVGAFALNAAIGFRWAKGRRR